MLIKILLWPFHLVHYYYLRVLNSLIVRINENYLTYPIGFIHNSLSYSRKLRKIKSNSLGANYEKCLNLKGRIFDFGVTKSKINSKWLIQSKDDEISYIPRRLFWLLYELSNETSPDFISLKDSLEKFIFDFQNSLSISNFSPYILSECLSNINLFNRAIYKTWVIQESSQRKFILSANLLLVRHLEFRGPFSTCNHLLNNFRGLYLSSSLIQNKNKNEFFLNFWNQIKNKVFLPNGKIKDGSVHYHFLISRWLFEICIYAHENKDFYILQKVNPYLTTNLEIADLLSRNNNLPYFGDVSPDCPLNWLKPISLYSGRKHPYKDVGSGTKGWDRIWNIEKI